MIAAESLLPTWGDRLTAIALMLIVFGSAWLASLLFGRNR